jgi:dienelactone hydrolase
VQYGRLVLLWENDPAVVMYRTGIQQSLVKNVAEIQPSFFNNTRASSYNAEAATDAWDKTLAWLRQYLMA